MGIPKLGIFEIKQINSLIPEAVRIADILVRDQFVYLKKKPAQKWPDVAKTSWNQIYHEHMDILAKAEGLRR